MLKRDLDDGERDHGARAGFREEVRWYCSHCWMKFFTSATIPSQWKWSLIFSSVFSTPQIAPEWVGVGQVHAGVYLGSWYHQEVGRLRPLRLQR